MYSNTGLIPLYSTTYSTVDTFAPLHKSKSSTLRRNSYQDTADLTGFFDTEIDLTDNAAYISKPTATHLVSPYAITKPQLPPKPKIH